MIVFETPFKALGIVIYATELILWIGVFACGGYFNFLPWAKMQLNSRRGRVELEVRAPQQERAGISLHENPSTTSVFRTASSLEDLRRRGIAEATAEG